jgi:hypothetical protein
MALQGGGVAKEVCGSSAHPIWALVGAGVRRSGRSSESLRWWREDLTCSRSVRKNRTKEGSSKGELWHALWQALEAHHFLSGLLYYSQIELHHLSPSGDPPHCGVCHIVRTILGDPTSLHHVEVLLPSSHGFKAIVSGWRGHPANLKHLVG